MKTYNVSVDRTSFYVEVDAKNEEEAIEKVWEGLKKGDYTCQEDETRYKVGLDIVENPF